MAEVAKIRSKWLHEGGQVISLVLATIGRTDDLDRLFGSLIAQTHQDYEVIVVDQNSDDRLVPHVDLALRSGINISHLRQAEPNLSMARNLGVFKAKGHIVAFPDDDCWYEPDSLARINSAFAGDPELGGLVALWVEQAESMGAGQDGQHLDLGEWRRFRGGNASSISLFFRRNNLLMLQGFDECLGVGQWYGAGEETDLVLRALEAGVVIRRCHAARVHHRFAADPRGERDHGVEWSKTRMRARGTGALYAKHRLPVAIVFRGVFMPLFRMATRPWLHRQLIISLATTCGRIEGVVGWFFKKYR